MFQNCIQQIKWYSSKLYSFIYKMLIQLEIESLIKQISRDSRKNIRSEKNHTLQSTTSSDSDDNKSTASSFLDITKSHIQTSHQIIKDLSLKFEKQVHKLTHICNDTFLSDKIVRLIGSFIKVMRVFKLTTKEKALQKMSFQIVQLRRLLRYNRFLSYMREIRHLILKSNKKWLDFYNIVFKNLQFVVDINDTLSYFQQMRLVPSHTFDQRKLKRNVANLYFVQCLMWLYLNFYDYVKNREHRTKAENLRKVLTIMKYLLDSFTSYNQFSRKMYTVKPQTITIVGTISSIVGLVVLWV